LKSMKLTDSDMDIIVSEIIILRQYSELWGGHDLFDLSVIVV
jgi:hypothetical protein